MSELEQECCGGSRAQKDKVWWEIIHLSSVCEGMQAAGRSLWLSQLTAADSWWVGGVVRVLIIPSIVSKINVFFQESNP